VTEKGIEEMEKRAASVSSRWKVIGWVIAGLGFAASLASRAGALFGIAGKPKKQLGD